MGRAQSLKCLCYGLVSQLIMTCFRSSISKITTSSQVGPTTAPEETYAVGRAQSLKCLCCGLVSQLIISSCCPLVSISISVAEVEFRDFVSILSVVKPSQATDTSNEIVTRLLSGLSSFVR